MKKWCTFLICVVFLCAGAASEAQQPPSRPIPLPTLPQPPLRGTREGLSITGHVWYEESKAPAQRIPVKLTRLSGEHVDMTYTDLTGQFEFPRVQPGSYYLKIDAPDYVKVEQRVELDFFDLGGLVIFLRQGAAASGESYTALVSVHDFKIPRQARKEFEQGMHALYQKQELARSIVHFQKAIELYPHYYEAYTELGLAFLDLEKLEEARQVFEKAIALNPKYSRSYFALGSLLNRLKKYQEAEMVLKKGLEVEPSGWQGYYHLGVAYLKQGQAALATKNLQRARELYPNFPTLHLLLYNALVAQADYRSALAELDAFMRAYPNDPRLPQVKQTAAELRKALQPPH